MRRKTKRLRSHPYQCGTKSCRPFNGTIRGRACFQRLNLRSSWNISSVHLYSERRWWEKWRETHSLSTCTVIIFRSRVFGLYYSSIEPVHFAAKQRSLIIKEKLQFTFSRLNYSKKKRKQGNPKEQGYIIFVIANSVYYMSVCKLKQTRMANQEAHMTAHLFSFTAWNKNNFEIRKVVGSHNFTNFLGLAWPSYCQTFMSASSLF